MLTIKDIHLAIVRAAERFPKRIGYRGALASPDGDRCILGQVLLDQAGGNPEKAHWYTFPISVTQEESRVFAHAVRLNDRGIPWGEIPKLLGLVPGEQPASEPVTEPALSEETVNA